MRSAQDVIRNLQNRIAKLERQAYDSDVEREDMELLLSGVDMSMSIINKISSAIDEYQHHGAGSLATYMETGVGVREMSSLYDFNNALAELSKSIPSQLKNLRKLESHARNRLRDA